MANEYKILQNLTSEELVKDVTEHLKNGWSLVGGVSTATFVDKRNGYAGFEYEYYINYAQAVTK